MSATVYVTGRRAGVAVASMLLAALCSAGLARPTHAQQQTVGTYGRTTFFHGFGADRKSWTKPQPNLNGLAPWVYLQNRVVLHTVTIPDLDRQNTFDQQKAIAVATIAGSTRNVLVGHSMGSLIARATFFDQPSNVAGIVAIAPPHQGVILADSAAAVAYWVTGMQDRINAGKAAIKSTFLNIALVTQLWAVYGLVSWEVDHSPVLDVSLVSGLPKLPALAALKQTSPTIDSLNRTFADSTVARVNITGRIPHKDALVRLAAAQVGADEVEMIHQVGRARAAFNGCRAIGYMTIVNIPNARRCGWAYRQLGSIDERWSRHTVGSRTVSVGAFSVQLPKVELTFDGVVPNANSVYPGLGSDPRINILSDGSSHFSIISNAPGLENVAIGMLSIGMAQNTTAAPPSVCGEAQCVPVTGAYITHYSGANCSGTESYYMGYGGSQSWDGTGMLGTVLRTATNRSYRNATGYCYGNAWPSGNTLSNFVTVYRTSSPQAPSPPVCGEAQCVFLSGAHVSHFTGPNCDGTESFYTPYFSNAPYTTGPRKSYDGGGVAGTALRTVTNRSYKSGTQCSANAWPNGHTLSNFVTIYR